ncbi:MAG: CehA/McbA family metallohydrolase, partial [Atribacterota bacterium]
SDGSGTSEEVVNAYKNAGYDFLCLTDHSHVTPDPGVEGILFIPGVEESPAYGHILGVGITRKTNALQFAAIIQFIQSQGGLAFYCHPNSEQGYGWTLDELFCAPFANGLEVLNGNSVAEDKWDALLSAGWMTWGIGTDDLHHIPGDLGQSWVMVNADSLTPDDILRSLRNGNFYTTQGPDLNIDVSGGTLTASTSEPSTFHWIGWKGTTLRETSGINNDTHHLQGNEKYIRLKVQRERDHKLAFSQPVFVE